MPPAAEAFETILDYLDPATKAAHAWKLESACKYEPTDLFYVDRGQSAQAAKLICSTCPVKVRCLAYAIEERMWDGIWGGTNEKERRPLIRLYESGVAVEALIVPLPKHGCGCDECNSLGQRRREAQSA
ncbi:MAG: WhiB family transcriptional regulator [Chloroflexi bacterium]|nr:WhiB family transcriptional regulator [Chloroflexota bacterium]